MRRTLPRTEIPCKPILFFKPPSSLIGDRYAIRPVAGWNRVWHQAELGVVPGRETYRVEDPRSSESAFGHASVKDDPTCDLRLAHVQQKHTKGFHILRPFGHGLYSTKGL
jgi:2-keto-4-pentenoate hydratase/2-oxohepta-3-ene-1,7-dioic acid hydratase in catechol pathway